MKESVNRHAECITATKNYDITTAELNMDINPV